MDGRRKRVAVVFVKVAGVALACLASYYCLVWIACDCDRDKAETLDLPDPPVGVSFRDGLQGIVVRFRNKVSRPLSLVIHCYPKDEDYYKERTYYMNLKPGSSKEIGWLQGWEFQSGDRIAVTVDGYTYNWEIFTPSRRL